MPSPKIICFANAKGGVGKTKASIALTDCLIGVHGQNVCLIDMDQQATASVSMLEGDVATLKRLDEQGRTIDCYFQGIALADSETSLEGFVLEKARVFAGPEPIPSKYGSLVPCSSRIDGIEQMIVRKSLRPDGVPANEHWLIQHEETIAKISSKFKHDIVKTSSRRSYDFVVIDTAAGIRLLTVAAMLVADSIIVPMIPDRDTVNASMRFMSQIRDYEIGTGRKFASIHMAFSKVQPGYRSHGDMISRIAAATKEGVLLTTPFLQRDIISELDAARSPLRRSFEQKYDIAAGNIKALTREILGLLGE